MTRHEHVEQRDRVAASVASTHHPDVYTRREVPSPETQAAAVRVKAARQAVEAAAAELVRARNELHAAVRADNALLDQRRAS